MSKGYWVAFADVSDPEGYKAYIAENAKAFASTAVVSSREVEGVRRPKARRARGW
jgi:uncharacterized protein (DUF1330 family)